MPWWDPESLPYRLPTYGDGDNFLYEHSRENGPKLQEMGQDASVLVHRNTLALAGKFLAFMMREGSSKEKAVYASLTPETLMLRLLKQRPLMFWLPQDAYKLKTSEQGEGGFELIGTEDEKPPLVLEHLMSYDEMAISSLVSVSVPTPFFNDGARSNCGRRDVTAYPFDGVYAGAVGARFERELVMEYAHMVVTPQQNTPENGYGRKASPGRRSEVLRLWAEFYGREYFPDFDEAKENADSYAKLPGCFLDPDIYKRRMRMSIEPFLLDADERARQKGGVQAYVHLVGLGLGQWAVHEVVQTDLMLEVYRDVLQEHALLNICTIDFSYFNASCNRGIVQHDRIRIAFSRRSPAEMVGPGELLVAMYAWDGNSFPGNEYWGNHLDNSGDPAAACCSAIALLQNPDVNPRLNDIDAVCVLPREPAAPLIPSSQPELSTQPGGYVLPEAMPYTLPPTSYNTPTAQPEPIAQPEPTAQSEATAQQEPVSQSDPNAQPENPTSPGGYGVVVAPPDSMQPVVQASTSGTILPRPIPGAPEFTTPAVHPSGYGLPAEASDSLQGPYLMAPTSYTDTTAQPAAYATESSAPLPGELVESYTDPRVTPTNYAPSELGPQPRFVAQPEPYALPEACARPGSVWSSAAQPLLTHSSTLEGLQNIDAAQGMPLERESTLEQLQRLEQRAPIAATYSAPSAPRHPYPGEGEGPDGGPSPASRLDSDDSRFEIRADSPCNQVPGPKTVKIPAPTAREACGECRLALRDKFNERELSTASVFEGEDPQTIMEDVIFRDLLREYNGNRDISEQDFEYITYVADDNGDRQIQRSEVPWALKAWFAFKEMPKSVGSAFTRYGIGEGPSPSRRVVQELLVTLNDSQPVEDDEVEFVLTLARDLARIAAARRQDENSWGSSSETQVRLTHETMRQAIAVWYMNVERSKTPAEVLAKVSGRRFLGLFSKLKFDPGTSHIAAQAHGLAINQQLKELKRNGSPSMASAVGRKLGGAGAACCVLVFFPLLLLIISLSSPRADCEHDLTLLLTFTALLALVPPIALPLCAMSSPPFIISCLAVVLLQFIVVLTGWFWLFQSTSVNCGEFIYGLTYFVYVSFPIFGAVIGCCCFCCMLGGHFAHSIKTLTDEDARINECRDECLEHHKSVYQPISNSPNV